jgi:two-component system, NarL family, response regulator LiaR
MSVRVLLVDDHRMMREGLRAILERSAMVSSVDDADNGRMALEMVETLRPQVVVMDVGMPELNGVEATRKIKAAFPDIQVVGLSMYADKRYVLGMLDAGASGYVLKGGAAAELVEAIEAVSQGKKYLSPEIANLVVEGYLNHQDPVNHPDTSVLGGREREVIQLLAEGNSSKEIGVKLGISGVTVETHRRNIMKKLGLHSVAELTKYAVREGLTRIEE